MGMPITSSFDEGELRVAHNMVIRFRDYHSADNGIPVICLPGFWRTSRDFEELAEHLGQFRRVITVDLRGRGKSDRSSDPADYHYDRLREDIVALMDACDVRRAVFVGLTLGGAIGVDIAAMYPDRVAAVVLNDTAPESNPAAGARMKAFSGAEELDRAATLARLRGQYGPDFPDLTDADYDRLLYRGYRVTEAGTYVRDFDQLTNVDLRRLVGERPTFWDTFDALSLPVLVLRGANSDYLTEALVDRMKAANPDTRIETIPDCGHPVMLWEPEALAAITSLLAEVDDA